MSFWSSSSGSSNNSYPHDMKSQSQLTGLYNQGVTNAERVERPLGSFSTPMGPVSHSGVRVTTKSGDQYLIHKGSDFGRSSNTVVVEANHMSDKWKVVETKPVDGKTVSDFVKKGGSDYSFYNNNCHKAAHDMME